MLFVRSIPFKMLQNAPKAKAQFRDGNQWLQFAQVRYHRLIGDIGCVWTLWTRHRVLPSEVLTNCCWIINLVGLSNLFFWQHAHMVMDGYQRLLTHPFILTYLCWLFYVLTISITVSRKICYKYNVCHICCICWNSRSIPKEASPVNSSSTFVQNTNYGSNVKFTVYYCHTTLIRRGWNIFELNDLRHNVWFFRYFEIVMHLKVN